MIGLNSIRSLLDAGLPLREIARIAFCSHGSVSLEKKVYLAEKKAQSVEKVKSEELAKQGLSALEAPTEKPLLEVLPPDPVNMPVLATEEKTRMDV